MQRLNGRRSALGRRNAANTKASGGTLLHLRFLYIADGAQCPLNTKADSAETDSACALL
jgi:hypothetical protein